MSRKRRHHETEDADEENIQPVPEPSILQRIRNMWEFASLAQYLFMFGKAVKIESLDVEDLEEMLIQPDAAPKLADLALALLKTFSSFRPLNLETFDSVARRQYQKKTMSHHNGPFGDEEEPQPFASFDIFTKLRVLHQLSTWTFNNPAFLREKVEDDELSWRMEPLGWDCEDCAYFVLDDDRLYRRTDAPLPASPPPMRKPKKTRNTRSNKRRRVSRTVVESESDEDEKDVASTSPTAEPLDDGLGGMKWELVAITHDEYNQFLETIKRSRDGNEKVLRKRLTEEVMPVIEKRAEQLRQKEARRLKELENIQKLATAKRSGRLANKAEKRKQEEEEQAAEEKRKAELALVAKEQEKQQRIDEARQSRMITREQRLKDREVKRILHEEELKKLAEDQERIANNDLRGSERHIKSEIERRQHQLKELKDEEDWTFDCSICGVHGLNVDDGTHSIECEKCKVWQHSKCHGISEDQAERDDFHFVCSTCKRKEEKRKEERSKEKASPIKLKFSSPRSTTADAQKTNGVEQKSPVQALVGVVLPAVPQVNGTIRQPQHTALGRTGETSSNPSSSFQPKAHNQPTFLSSAHGHGTSSNYTNGIKWQLPHTSPPTAFPTAPPATPFSNISRPVSSTPPIGSFYHRPSPPQSLARDNGSASHPGPPAAQILRNTNTSSHTSQHLQQALPPPLQSGSMPHSSSTLPPLNGGAYDSHNWRASQPVTPSSFEAGRQGANHQNQPIAMTPKAGVVSGTPTQLLATPLSAAASTSAVPRERGLSPIKQDSPRPQSGHGQTTPSLQLPPMLSPSVSFTAAMAPPSKKTPQTSPASQPVSLQFPE